MILPLAIIAESTEVMSTKQTYSGPNPVMLLLPTLFGLLVMVVIISCVICLVRNVIAMRKEQTLIRMELGKIAELISQNKNNSKE